MKFPFRIVRHHFNDVFMCNFMLFESTLRVLCRHDLNDKHLRVTSTSQSIASSNLSVCLSVLLPTYLPTYLLTLLPVYLSVYLSAHPPIRHQAWRLVRFICMWNFCGEQRESAVSIYTSQFTLLSPRIKTTVTFFIVRNWTFLTPVASGL
jgi:hypothetical protein